MQMDVKRKLGQQYISDKITFKTKTITKDKERHYVIIKGKIRQEDITIVNIYTPNMTAVKYTKQLITNIK